MKLILKSLVLSSFAVSLACSGAAPSDGGDGDGDDSGDGDGDLTGDGDGDGDLNGDGDGDGGTNPPLPNGPTTDALETVPAANWVSYDPSGTALTWEIKDDGTGNTIIHAVSTGTPDGSVSVSLSIPQADLTDDVARSMGVRFNISGTGSILFQAQSGAVVPTESGGWCDPDATACWNAHEESVTLGSMYQTVEFLWNDMVQPWGTDTNPVVLYPSDILLLSWIIPTDMAGEFFLDSIELIPDDGSGVQSGLGALISKAEFNAFAPSAMGYTYENFLEAAKAFPAFGGDLDPVWGKREIAMFLGNAKWETGEFVYTVEQNPGTYCDAGQPYGCPAGASEYYGRGAMQLSWNYNYKAAGDYLGVDLLNNPGLVASDPVMLWRSALWFWMNPGHSQTPHAVYKSGLGATIQLINGPSECGGGRPDALAGRLKNYTDLLMLMGVDVGATGTTC